MEYHLPDRQVIQTLRCMDDGNWDYHPFRCEPYCGKLPATGTKFIVGGTVTNNTQVPWHVAVYKRSGSAMSQICGGTIVNAKIVISAAHCFYDELEAKFFKPDLFTIAAGKFYRDFNAVEPLQTQVRNITEIVSHK